MTTEAREIMNEAMQVSEGLKTLKKPDHQIPESLFFNTVYPEMIDVRENKETLYKYVNKFGLRGEVSLVDDSGKLTGVVVPAILGNNSSDLSKTTSVAEALAKAEISNNRAPGLGDKMLAGYISLYPVNGDNSPWGEINKIYMERYSNETVPVKKLLPDERLEEIEMDGW